MIIYIEFVVLLNIFLDFILLMSVSIVLKRFARVKRLLLGSLIGGGSTLIIFFSINYLVLIFLKILLGILMVIIAFGFYNIKYTFNNLLYLLMISFCVGGILFLLMDNGFYNYLILVLGFIIVCYVYIKQSRKISNNYNNYYKVDIFYQNNKISLIGYLDTGNNLYDNYKHRPIILIDKKIKYREEDIIYVSYQSLNNESILKCLRIEKVIINNHIFKNYLVGLANKKICIDGVDCLLHNKMRGEIDA